MGINNQKVQKCIHAKGDVAKYTQGDVNFAGSHVFFMFFLFICYEEVSPCSNHEFTHRFHIFDRKPWMSYLLRRTPSCFV